MKFQKFSCFKCTFRIFSKYLNETTNKKYSQQQVELSFKTGDCVLVYGDMDEDGFYMGEIDGVRGLVPSNFLADADNMQSTGLNSTQAQQRNNRGRVQGPGPGARGPPPPPRDGVMHTGGQRPRKGNVCDFTSFILSYDKHSFFIFLLTVFAEFLLKKYYCNLSNEINVI